MAALWHDRVRLSLPRATYDQGFDCRYTQMKKSYDDGCPSNAT
jgi:steroid 5-alpha reductase family enzyme